MSELIALAIALVPAIPILQVSNSQLAKARSYWLLGLLTLAICWLAWSELWLALIGFVFLCRWRSHQPLASLVQWVGIGASWFLLLTIPLAAWEWVVFGWLAVALWQVKLLIERWWLVRRRMVGTLGSPPLTGIYLALVWALAPWFVWPVLALGVVVTSSILAGVAVAIAVVWLYPWTWVLFLGVGFAVTIAWGISPAVCGRRILEWTLRGDTLDSWWARWYAWRVILHDFRHSPQHWLTGHGPNAAQKTLRSWASRIHVELPHEVTNEALHLTYEYGVIGGLAALAFVVRVGPHLMLGDPWSAAWLAGALMSFGHWPCRHVLLGLVWLAISARVVLP